MEAAASGDALMLERKYDEAVKAYTLAIEESPESPNYHLGRAIAQHKIKNYDAALADSERTIALALSRGNKSIRATAQFRRGLALYCLGRLSDALFCLRIAQRDDCQDKSLDIWLAKLTGTCKDMEPVTSNISEVPAGVPDGTYLPVRAASSGEPQQTKQLYAQPKARELQSFAGNGKQHETLKHEWYETLDVVVISIYMKGLSKDECDVEFASDKICVNLSKVEPCASRSKRFEPLFGAIKSTESSYRVMSTKIEISAKKVRPGKWSQLLKDRSVICDENKDANTARAQKNWDHLTEYDEEQQADDGGDAALTSLFQTLYKDADEDTRKAMVKSYTESGGTSLSTDWNSVRKQRVEIQPPEGMKACKFE